jgi:hypothetical protein
MQFWDFQEEPNQFFSQLPSRFEISLEFRQFFLLSGTHFINFCPSELTHYRLQA